MTVLREPTVEHVVISGVPRFGKSVLATTLNLPRMLQRDGPAFVVIDPPGTMVEEMAAHLVRQGRPFLYDRLYETDATLGYDFFTPSTNPDKEQAQAENREAISEAIAVLVRARGQTSVEASPMTRQGLYDAFALIINQDAPVPFFMLRNCFVKETDEYQYLLAHCTDPETYMRFIYYAGLNAKDRDIQCGPAERIIRTICESPQFRKRSTSTFELAEFLNSGGKLFIDGRSIGNLSRPDASFLMGQIILTVIRLARSGKLSRRVVLIIDEGANVDPPLIDLNLTRAMNEAAKWGIEIQVILQNPLFKDPNITDNLFNAANTRFFFKHVNPSAGKWIAEMIGVPHLDPLIVKKTEYRTVQRHDGFELERVISSGQWESEDGKSGKSQTENFQARPKYREEIEERDILFTLDELIKLKYRDVTNLGVGQCFVMKGNTVTKEPVSIEKLAEPWAGRAFSRHPYVPLWKEKLRLYMEQLKTTNPAYQRGVSLPVWTPPPPPAKKGKKGLD